MHIVEPLQPPIVDQTALTGRSIRPLLEPPAA
jgi:hypothetical protein